MAEDVPLIELKLFNFYSLSSELEVLQSIYVDELLVEEREDGSCELSLVLFPSTAEDSVSQFVCLTLTLEVDSQYPSSAPNISIKNPRGLSDDKLNSMRACLQSEAQSCLGSPVLYQLIEKAKEILTESNIPHGNCVICLYGFKEGEAFTKTCCYHYFHSHCLGRYVRHSESEILLREKELQEDKTRASAGAQELCVVCPVCREALTYDVDQLLSCPAPKLPELSEAAMSLDFHQRWRELQKVLEKQRSKGGIIDPEEESNRFLIHINEPRPENTNQDLDDPLHPQTPSAALPSSAEPKPLTLSPSAHAPTHRSTHQRVSGPRRRRPGSDRSNAISERLDRLSLDSDGADHCRHQKTQGRSETLPVSKAGPEFDSLTDDTSGGPGHLDRRRRGGHQRRPGPPRYHWNSRAPRGPSRGIRQREEVL